MLVFLLLDFLVFCKLYLWYFKFPGLYPLISEILHYFCCFPGELRYSLYYHTLRPNSVCSILLSTLPEQLPWNSSVHISTQPEAWVLSCSFLIYHFQLFCQPPASFAICESARPVFFWTGHIPCLHKDVYRSCFQFIAHHPMLGSKHSALHHISW